MRRTKDDAAQTRQDLLDAALTTFSRDGYDAARLKDIAEAAGVTRGAIYHHFENKAGLFMALIEEASSVGNKAIQQAIEEGGELIEVVERILIYALNLLEDDRRFREVMKLSLFMVRPSPELGDFAQQRREESLTLTEGIGGFFKMGIDQGVLRADIDPSTIARAFLGYQNGLVLLWLVNPDAFSIKEIAPELAEIFLRGIAVT